MAADRYITQIRMPQALADEVKAYADRRGISLNTAFCLLMRDAITADALIERERELILAKS